MSMFGQPNSFNPNPMRPPQGNPPTPSLAEFVGPAARAYKNWAGNAYAGPDPNAHVGVSQPPIAGNPGVQVGPAPQSAAVPSIPAATPSQPSHPVATMRPVPGALPQPPISAFPSGPTPDSAHLPDWARQQVRAGGGRAENFTVHGGQLLSALKPEQIQGLSSVAPPSPNQAAATEPVVHPTPGIQTQRSPQGQPGVRTVAVQPTSAQVPTDPLRQQLVESARMAAQAASNSRQQWFYPPGTSTEPVFAPNLRNDQAQAAAEALSRYDLTRATVAEKDPNKQIEMLRKIAGDPRLRGTYLAGRGADPATIASLNQPGEQGPTGEPTIPEEEGLLGRLRLAKSVPGIADPSHPQHQSLQQWVNQRYANPNSWAEETYVPPDPNSFNAPSFLTRPAGLVAAAVQGLTGVAGPTSAGTGFSWPQNFRDRTEQQELLNRIGIRPPGGQ